MYRGQRGLHAVIHLTCDFCLIMGKIMIHALTRSESRIVNAIVTPVEVKNLFTQVPSPTQAIWDTGATASVITKDSSNNILNLCILNLLRHTYLHFSNTFYLPNLFFFLVKLLGSSIFSFATALRLLPLALSKAIRASLASRESFVGVSTTSVT